MPTAERPSRPPSRTWLLNELTGPAQVLRLTARAPRLRTLPRGDGQPVIDVPGWRTPEATMAPLRTYLRWLGHDARGWGYGVHHGSVAADRDRLVQRVRQVVEETGRPVHLVGWSLGGVIAREAARLLPDEVVQVITFGSPIIGGGVYTSVGEPQPPERQAQIVRRIDAAEAASPLTQPVTSIFSRRDAVVAWRASVDHHSPDVTHVEVGSTHLSLGVDPDVWEIVARTLVAHR